MVAFGKPKAGPHHSANQVRRGFKARTGRRSRKHACITCGGRNYRRVCADCFSPEARLLAAIEAKEQLRDVRIATLVEAAGLVCVGCRLGNEMEVLQEGAFEKYPHHADEGLCDARRIIFKLMENWA